MPPRLADVAPGDYGALEDVVARALAKSPGRSLPVGGRDVGGARRGARRAQRVREHGGAAEGQPTTRSAMIPITVGSSVQVARPSAPRSRAPLVIVLLLLLAAGGAAA